jgi:hypothetical protein
MLMPIDDLNIIFSIMIKDQLDQELIEAIKLLNIDYIENEESMHAEMKIIDKLLELKARGEYYIGITKLTCAICKITIDTINGHEGSISINTRGTHGGTYQG